MFLARVIGTVVATQKEEKLEGSKLLVVQHLDMQMKPIDSFAVAVDGVGAGEGEVVICVTGSSARQSARTSEMPVDCLIAGIVDYLDIEGECRYKKE
jgi:carbon dioxide concentrating mechanism protein CcmL